MAERSRGARRVSRDARRGTHQHRCGAVARTRPRCHRRRSDRRARHRYRHRRAPRRRDRRGRSGGPLRLRRTVRADPRGDHRLPHLASESLGRNGICGRGHRGCAAGAHRQGAHPPQPPAAGAGERADRRDGLIQLPEQPHRVRHRPGGGIVRRVSDQPARTHPGPGPRHPGDGGGGGRPPGGRCPLPRRRRRVPVVRDRRGPHRCGARRAARRNIRRARRCRLACIIAPGMSRRAQASRERASRERAGRAAANPAAANPAAANPAAATRANLSASAASSASGRRCAPCLSPDASGRAVRRRRPQGNSSSSG